MLLQLIAWKKKQVMFSFYDSTKDFLVNAVIFQQNGRHVTYVCLTAKENVKAFFFILRLWVADRGQLIITRSLLTNLNFRAKYSFLIFFQNIWIFKLKIAGSFVDFWRENLILTNLKNWLFEWFSYENVLWCDKLTKYFTDMFVFYYVPASKWIFSGCLNSMEEKCWQTIWRGWRMLHLLFYPSWIHLSNAQSGLSHMQEKIPFCLSLQMVFH